MDLSHITTQPKMKQKTRLSIQKIWKLKERRIKIEEDQEKQRAKIIGKEYGNE